MKLSKEELGQKLKNIWLNMLHDVQQPYTIEDVIDDIAETPEMYPELGPFEEDTEELDGSTSFHHQLIEDKKTQLREIAKELGIIE